MQHAADGLGGSTAARTIACPGWRKLADRAPEPVSSPYADEGSLLHEAMTRAFAEDDVSLAAGLTRGDLVMTDDRLQTLRQALDLFGARWADLDWFEQEVQVALPGVAGAWGTADLVFQAEGELVVLDWKFGQGVRVEAEENAQLMFYAAGYPEIRAGGREDSEPVTLAIIQPSYGLSEWRTTAGRLRTFTAQFAEAVAAGEHPAPPLALGKHCRFCPAKVICPKVQGVVQSALDGGELRREQLGEYLRQIETLEGWIRDVKSLARRELESGAGVPGWKLVAGRTMRSWASGALAEIKKAGLLRLLAPRELVTPAAAEKVLREHPRWDRVASLIEIKKAAPSMVPTEDARPGIPNLAAAAASLGSILR